MGWVCTRGRQWAKSRGCGGHTYQGGPLPQGGRGEAAGTHSPSGGCFFLRSRRQRVRLPPDGGVGQVGLKGPSSLCITGLGGAPFCSPVVLQLNCPHPRPVQGEPRGRLRGALERSPSAWSHPAPPGSVLCLVCCAGVLTFKEGAV